MSQGGKPATAAATPSTPAGAGAGDTGGTPTPSDFQNHLRQAVRAQLEQMQLYENQRRVFAVQQQQQQHLQQQQQQQIQPQPQPQAQQQQQQPAKDKKQQKSNTTTVPVISQVRPYDAH
mmetsp:Transcript_18692/g.41580  ORF Transcript_18692/g.41580 Transcript_18692/m.41580 type:complete len:119 (-) Transcript_18692:2591-2947(-)